MTDADRIAMLRTCLINCKDIMDGRQMLYSRRIQEVLDATRVPLTDGEIKRLAKMMADRGLTFREG